MNSTKDNDLGKNAMCYALANVLGTDATLCIEPQRCCRYDAGGQISKRSEAVVEGAPVLAERDEYIPAADNGIQTLVERGDHDGWIDALTVSIEMQRLMLLPRKLTSGLSGGLHTRRDISVGTSPSSICDAPTSRLNSMRRNRHCRTRSTVTWCAKRMGL